MIINKLLKPTYLKRILFFLLLDIIFTPITLFLAYNLRFNFKIPADHLNSFWLVVGLLIFFKIFYLWLFNIYKVPWRFFSLNEVKKIIYALILSYLSVFIIYYIIPYKFNPFPRSVLIIDFFLYLTIILVVRFSKRFLLEKNKNSNKPTLIIGANQQAQNIIKSFIHNEIDYYPVAILDEEKKGTFINNVEVIGKEDLEKTIKKYNIKYAIITDIKNKSETDQIIKVLNDLGIYKIKKVQLLEDTTQIKDISIEDFLAREPKDLDIHTIQNFIKNKKILVTGGGGSIGSEIVRQCFKFNAKEIAVIEHSEYNLYKIKEEIESIKPYLGSVVDKKFLERVFNEFRPDIVVHAAAYKHVPLCEENPYSAVLNNVLGTKNIIDYSIKYNVKKLVNISTDKAVRPTNVMGATKRVGELYAANVESKNTEIVSVRFGNVLGSSGSVIPKFKQQIENGGPITVTHPEITRYFMLIPEACQLVLQAASIAKGGEIFILDMGEPVKIVDLAKRMIKLYGKENEIDIVFTGLRPGEKLYEELLINESEKQTKYKDIFIARKTIYPIKQLEKDIEELLSCENKKECLKKIVPEYTPYKDNNVS